MCKVIGYSCWVSNPGSTNVERNVSHRTSMLNVNCNWLAGSGSGGDCVWNVMAHEQKPDFVFRRNGRVHLNRRGASVQWTAGSRGVRISGSNAGYTTFRGSVKGSGYPLHSPVIPSHPPPLRHRVPSHFNRTLAGYRRFGTTHRPNLQRSSGPRRISGTEGY